MPRTPPASSARALSGRTPAHPQRPALALLLCAGCGAAPPPMVELPRVPVADAVPDARFDVPAPSWLGEQLACSRLDPTGRSLATRRAVVRVDHAFVWVDEQPVAPTAALYVEDARTVVDSTSILDALNALAMDHKATAERSPCAAQFTGALLIEAPADLPVGALLVVIANAGSAGYGDLWLRVATETLEAEPASVEAQDKPPWLLDGLPTCMRGLGLSWSHTGELFVARWGQPDLTPDQEKRYLEDAFRSTHQGLPTAVGLNTAELRAQLPSLPAWAQVQVALRPTRGAPIRDLIAAMDVVREVYGPRTLIGTGEVGLRPPHRAADVEGPQIAALPYLLPPSCVMPWMTDVHTCAGLDGQEHPREAAELGTALNWGPRAHTETLVGSAP